MIPPFPIISIYKNRDIEVLQGELLSHITTLSVYRNTKAVDNVYYDKNGLKWTLSVHSAYKPTLLTKLFASTIFNPYIIIKRTWIQAGPYPLTELIEKINHSIELDNDIIMRFIGVDTLKAKVASCSTFESILRVLHNDVLKPEPQRISEAL